MIDLITDFVTNLLILPFNLAISLTNFEEIIWFSTSDIKKIVSMVLFNFLFIPANWNSYSKSETALKPRMMIAALYFLHKFTVNVLKGIIIIFFFDNLRSEKSDFFIISILLSIGKK